jgi:hypothetical protein
MRNHIRARSAGKAKARLGPRRAAPEEEAEVVEEAVAAAVAAVAEVVVEAADPS